MGFVPAFFSIATKQRLLLGYTCEIPRCYCRVWKFNARSELRVNSADFEVGENRLETYRSLEYPLIFSISVCNVDCKTVKNKYS